MRRHVAQPLIALAFAIATFAAPEGADASVVTFEFGPPSPDHFNSVDLASYDEAGFRIVATPKRSFIVDPRVSIFPPGDYAPTSVASSNVGFVFAELRLTSIAGAPFALTAFDLIETQDLLFPYIFSLVGDKSDGSTVTANFVTDQLYGPQTIALQHFDDLVSVRFGTGDSFGALAIDNLVVTPSARVVPEPETAMLFVFGFLLLIWQRLTARSTGTRIDYMADAGPAPSRTRRSSD